MSKISGKFSHRENPDIFKRKVHRDPNDEIAKINSFADYMGVKKRKLLRQVHDGTVPTSRLFSGISIYVNGLTNPPASDLRKIIVENGGEYHHNFSNKSTTFMVASCMAATKWKLLPRSIVVIRPEWIVESIRSRTRLPIPNFLLLPNMGLSFTKRNIRNANNARQTLISEFTNIHRNSQSQKVGREGPKNNFTKRTVECPRLYDEIHRKPEPSIKEKNGIFGKVDTTVKKEWEKRKGINHFEYGWVGNKTHPDSIFVGKLVIRYNKGISDEKESPMDHLMALYKNLLDDLQTFHVRTSVRFMERVFNTKSNVHCDWLELIAMLKSRINAECMCRHGALLFPSPTEQK